jgi:hypothetical protein
MLANKIISCNELTTYSYQGPYNIEAYESITEMSITYSSNKYA